MEFTNYSRNKTQNKENSPLTPLTSGPHWSVGGVSSLPGSARAVACGGAQAPGRAARGGGWPAAARAAARLQQRRGARVRDPERRGGQRLRCPNSGAKQGKRRRACAGGGGALAAAERRG